MASSSAERESGFEALYLHVPFCRSKCAYCDFDSRALVPQDSGGAWDDGALNSAAQHGLMCAGGSRPDAIDCYLNNLHRLIDRYGAAGELASVQTVYIGGGTPSLLGARLVELVARVRAYCTPAEFTCEANPESFASELAEALHTAGVTRISLGVQSLDDAELRAIGRIHSADQALCALACARAQGFSTSCDVMCGLPGQTVESWADTLDTLIATGPDHVSVYPLQLEEGTPLAQRVDAGEVAVPDEDMQATFMELASERLTSAGYARYEVASYAKPGHRCQHNIAYWTGVNYLGLGRSAASMAAGPLAARLGEAGLIPFDFPASGRVRFKQHDDAGEHFDVEMLSAREALAEDLMLACRMTDGISAALLDSAAHVIGRAAVDAACARAVELDLARWKGTSLVPTRTGWLEGNELYGLFWDLAE